MNQRELPCGKKYRAVGMEGSRADLFEKVLICKKCLEAGCPTRLKILDEYIKGDSKNFICKLKKKNHICRHCNHYREHHYSARCNSYCGVVDKMVQCEEVKR